MHLFFHLVNTSKLNEYSLNILVGTPPLTALLILRSQMIFLTSSREFGRNDNLIMPLNFVFIFH